VGGAIGYPDPGEEEPEVSYISVTVPTVLRGFLLVVFCSIDMAGGEAFDTIEVRFLHKPRNCRAYAERD